MVESLLERKIEESDAKNQLWRSNQTIELALKKSEDEIKSAIHRIVISYENSQEDKDIDCYDPTDTARPIKAVEYAQDELDIYFLDKKSKPHQVKFGFSYLGSGVMKNAYNTILDEFRNAADQWDEAPSPEQAGRLLRRVLGEAVMKAGDHIDPDTKERMLFWMKTPEGIVWRAFYEAIAPVKTLDYNFNTLS